MAGTTWGCGKGFHRKGDLNRHLRRKNAEQCRPKSLELTSRTSERTNALAGSVNAQVSQLSTEATNATIKELTALRMREEAGGVLIRMRDGTSPNLSSNPARAACSQTPEDIEPFSLKRRRESDVSRPIVALEDFGSTAHHSSPNRSNISPVQVDHLITATAVSEQLSDLNIPLSKIIRCPIATRARSHRMRLSFRPDLSPKDGHTNTQPLATDSAQNESGLATNQGRHRSSSNESLDYILVPAPSILLWISELSERSLRTPELPYRIV